ncbi:hypothetical protein IVB38_06940 [Bradyrhizobium sp. 38]|uniref:hypothetical protein n=1 Tax=unclassified Bradyrhizobium TaxID=2631580 RepID=UPI001FFBAE0C|nr:MULTISPECIES: hypothetical protein [unclassified Bradyrhizobium]MCK1335773.1 hypothetical protein [Bradyrhizobium sp. 38]MCK1474877.1 hypothetical protein [Bradyrhizobium sp. 197]
MGTSENLGACLRGQNRLEIRGVAPLSSVSRLSLARSRYARPVAVPGRVKLGDLRVSEDEIRILSFHVQLQRAFARWRIMEPFANSHAREITAGTRRPSRGDVPKRRKAVAQLGEASW